MKLIFAIGFIVSLCLLCLTAVWDFGELGFVIIVTSTILFFTAEALVIAIGQNKKK